MKGSDKIDTTALNLADISAFGVPTLILGFIAFVFMKYFPQFSNSYKESKAKENEVIKNMQEKFTIQTEKIIETAAITAKALEQNTQAFNANSKVLEQNTQSWTDTTAMLKSILDAIRAVEESNKQLNKTVEGQVTEVKAVKSILEKESGDK